MANPIRAGPSQAKNPQNYSHNGQHYSFYLFGSAGRGILRKNPFVSALNS